MTKPYDRVSTVLHLLNLEIVSGLSFGKVVMWSIYVDGSPKLFVQKVRASLATLDEALSL